MGLQPYTALDDTALAKANARQVNATARPDTQSDGFGVAYLCSYCLKFSFFCYKSVFVEVICVIFEAFNFF